MWSGDIIITFCLIITILVCCKWPLNAVTLTLKPMLRTSRVFAGHLILVCRWSDFSGKFVCPLMPNWEVNKHQIWALVYTCIMLISTTRNNNFSFFKNTLLVVTSDSLLDYKWLTERSWKVKFSAFMYILYYFTCYEKEFQSDSDSLYG